MVAWWHGAQSAAAIAARSIGSSSLSPPGGAALKTELESSSMSDQANVWFESNSWAVRCECRQPLDWHTDPPAQPQPPHSHTPTPATRNLYMTTFPGTLNPNLVHPSILNLGSCHLIESRSTGDRQIACLIEPPISCARRWIGAMGLGLSSPPLLPSLPSPTWIEARNG